MSDSLRPHGLEPGRLLCPWNSPATNSGVGCHALLQGIFLIQGSNPGLLHLQADSLPPEPPGKSTFTGELTGLQSFHEYYLQRNRKVGRKMTVKKSKQQKWKRNSGVFRSSQGSVLADGV